MSAAVTGKIAPGTKHEELMKVLQRAITGIQEMIQKRTTPATFSRFARALSEEELKKLPQALALLEHASKYATHQKLEDLTVAMVCESKALVGRFKLAHLRTVMDMWRLSPDVLIGLLEQCEELGVKNELHMYLFVRR